MPDGRRPLPTRLKMLKGNPGKRPINKKEPKIKKGKPVCPEWSSDLVKQSWETVCEILNDMGIMSTVDRLSVEMLCDTYALFRQATEELKAVGSPYFETTNGNGGRMIRVHPAIQVKSDCDRRIRAWLIEFGMTPAARSKIKVDDDAEDSDSIAESFFAAA